MEQMEQTSTNTQETLKSLDTKTEEKKLMFVSDFLSSQFLRYWVYEFVSFRVT